jgi:hypothetical protein
MLHLRPLLKGGAIAIVISLTSVESGIAAQCKPLQVVDGTGTSVTKKVQRKNWNTDFAVPNSASFSSYVATLKALAGNGKTFKVKMNLKYPNGTVDEAFSGDVLLAAGQSEQFTARPRVGSQPYQVNMVVGGLDAITIGYSLSVVGCP